MYVIDIEVNGDKELIADLERIGKDLTSGLEEALDTAGGAIANELKHQAPKFTNALADSMEVVESRKGEREIGPGGGTGSPGSPLPKAYALYVEEGSSPHMPNVGNIAERYGVDENEAFLIARKISESPGKATKFVFGTLPRARELFYEAIDKLVAFVIK